MRLAAAAIALIAVAALNPAAHAKSKGPAPVRVHLTTSTGDDAGYVLFTQQKKGLHINVELKNLPVGDHAVHVHQVPKCDAPDFKTAGGHFNPDGKKHGMNNPAGHHNGDLPQNITVGPDHTGHASFTVNYLSLDPMAANSIVANGGTSVIVHEKPDDMMTDPTGNAGNRIACGVVIGTPAP